MFGLSDAQKKEIEACKQESDKLRNRLYRASNSDEVTHLSNELDRIRNTAWDVVDLGVQKALEKNRKNCGNKTEHNKSMTAMLKAVMAKHRSGVELDEEIRQCNEEALSFHEDVDEDKERAQNIVQANIAILEGCPANALLNWRVETKAGAKDRAALYIRHAEEMLYSRNVVGAGGEKSWRLAVLLDLCVVNQSSNAQTPEGTSVVESAPQNVSENSAAGHDARVGVLGGVAAAKRRRMDAISSLQSMSTDGIEQFAKAHFMDYEGQRMSYEDMVRPENEEMLSGYHSDGGRDEMFNAWYARAEELVGVEDYQPPFHDGPQF